MSTRRGTSHGSASTSTRAPPCSGTLDAGAGPSSGGSLEEGRAKWIQDRQEELDRVFDRHDSLIREAFHLEKFVSLLSYDPKIAKEDRSDVFQRFQAQYDLVDHTASAGPSRRTTRRAHTARVQGLKVHATTASTPPSARTKKIEGAAAPAFWDIKAEAKSKGKQHAEVAAADMPSITYLRKGKGKQGVVDIPPPADMSKTRSSRHAPSAGDQHTDSRAGA
ncbi:hypothetical protein BD311DRAFT_800539, partial [Dichomitus squalens]